MNQSPIPCMSDTKVAAVARKNAPSAPMNNILFSMKILLFVLRFSAIVHNFSVQCNNDISLFVPLLDIAVRLDDLLQRIDPVYDRFELARLNQLFEED